MPPPDVDLDLTKLRMPIGSMVVDIALVVAIIYGGGQLTEKLSQVSARVERIENRELVMTNNGRAIGVLEARQNADDQFRVELNHRLDKLEEGQNAILVAVKSHP